MRINPNYDSTKKVKNKHNTASRTFSFNLPLRRAKSKCCPKLSKIEGFWYHLEGQNCDPEMGNSKGRTFTIIWNIPSPAQATVGKTTNS